MKIYFRKFATFHERSHKFKIKNKKQNFDGIKTRNTATAFT